MLGGFYDKTWYDTHGMYGQHFQARLGRGHYSWLPLTKLCGLDDATPYGCRSFVAHPAAL